jgi:hypothetical protein
MVIVVPAFSETEKGYEPVVPGGVAGSELSASHKSNGSHRRPASSRYDSKISKNHRVTSDAEPATRWLPSD